MLRTMLFFSTPPTTAPQERQGPQGSQGETGEMAGTDSVSTDRKETWGQKVQFFLVLALQLQLILKGDQEFLVCTDPTI